MSIQTRAAVAWKAGQPLSIETLDLAGPVDGEVLVEVKATGICHTDDFTLSGADPEGLFPAIFGHEGAGTVVDVEPRRYTSVTAFFDLDVNPRDVRTMPVSLHLFDASARETKK